MRSCARWLALMTVRTRAMDLRRSCLCPRDGTKLDRSAQDGERESVRARSRKRMYILFSLEAFPPEIFCTRNWPSSVFSSRSCFWRSSFDLPHNWTVLILVVFDYQPNPHVSPCVSQSEFSFFLPSCPRICMSVLRKSSGVVTCSSSSKKS